MTINRIAVDLSHYNGTADFGQMWEAGVRLVIHKASESVGAPDDKYVQRRKDMIGAKHPFLWGAYHFGRGTDIKQQLDSFFLYAQPDETTGLFLDWEAASMTTPMARSFLEQCDRRWGRMTGLYSYAAFLNEHLGIFPDTFFGLHPLWFAEYTLIPRNLQISWDKYFLWQYSDGQVGLQPHACPGITGDVDEDSFDGSEADLRQEWATWLGSGTPGVPVIAPAPPVAPQTTFTGDRKPVFDLVRTLTLGQRLVQRQVNQLDSVMNGWVPDGSSRLTFFNLVRDMTAYGRFTQAQVDILDKALNQWETSNH